MSAGRGRTHWRSAAAEPGACRLGCKPKSMLFLTHCMEGDTTRRAAAPNSCHPTLRSGLQLHQLVCDDLQPGRLAALLQRPQMVPLHLVQLEGAGGEPSPPLQ